MISPFDQPAFRLFAIASLLLVATLYRLAFLTGKVRDQSKAVVNPEDVRVYHGASVVDLDHPNVLRVKRAHLNLLENAVPFFVIGLLYALTRPGPAMASVLFFGFVGIRWVHAFVYMKRLQPVRAGAFAAGVLVNVIMAALVVRALF